MAKRVLEVKREVKEVKVVGKWIVVHDGKSWCICQKHTGNVGTRENVEVLSSEQECKDFIAEFGLTERHSEEKALRPHEGL